MGNVNCNNCVNSENTPYNNNNIENLDIIKNDSYISFQKETEQPKLEENIINQLQNISNHSQNDKKEEEKKEEEPILLKSKQNDNNSEELIEKTENFDENENKELNIANCKIPKKETPSSKMENKTRNIINDLEEINNDDNNINNSMQTKSNKNEENNKENIVNGSHKSELEEEKEEKEEEKEEVKYEYNIKDNNLVINDINPKGNSVELNIYNIFPKNKLLQLEDNSILCHGFLEKIIKIPNKNKFIYNERFCILTKKTFAYYKSKENYLNLWKPLFSIKLQYIKKVEQTVSDDKTFYFGLICIINDETREYVNKINTFVNNNENNKEEFLIGFRSKNRELILKWIIILNYFKDNYDSK